MSTHKEYINEFIASQDPTVQQDAVSKIVDLLQNNKLTLLNFIQALQMYITSTNDTIRISTFTLLSQILGTLSPTKLYPKDIEVLMAFLYSKLLDKPVVKFVLSSMFSLLKMKYFNNENTTELFQKLIDNYNPKEHPQSIRMLALKIVNYQIESVPQHLYPTDLAINCFLHASQNEKDPNNLFLIFQILQKISKTFDISNHVQPLFDTMFRYYPISFKSSSDAQETQINSLKDSLNTSLASNDLYAVELFPNLIDKYNSATSSQVKLDILKTISIVSKFYSKTTIQEHFLAIWNTLKYTLINQELAQLVSIPTVLSYYEGSSNETDQIFHSALISIRDLAEKLNEDSKTLVFDDLSKNLIISERNYRRFLQSYLTLAIISITEAPVQADNNDQPSDEILEKTLSTLFSPEQPIDEIKNKRMILVALSYFVSDSKFITQLVPFRDDILNILQASLSSSALETTLRTLAVELTCDLILSPTIVSSSTGIEFGLLDEERAILIGKLGELLIENGLQPVRDFNKVTENSLLLALGKLSNSSKCENDILNEVINKILLELNNLEYTLHEKCVLLNYLIKIAQTPSLVNIISIRLVNLLPNEGFDSTECNIPVHLILQALTSLIISLPLNYDMNTITKKFLPLLVGFVFKQGSAVDELQINYVSGIVRRMVVGLNDEISLIMVLELFKVFTNLFQLDNIVIPDQTISSFGDGIVNIEAYTSLINYKHVPILLSALQGLNIDVSLNSTINFTQIVNALISLMNNESQMDNLTRIQYLVGLSIIFNKYLQWEDFSTLFKGFSIQSSPDELEIKVWCLYGLILKCDINATEAFVELLGLLTVKQATKTISIIFTTISEVSEPVRESNDLLNDAVDIEHGLNIDVQLMVVYKKEKTSLMMIRNKNRLVVSNMILRNMWKQRILEILLSKKEEGNMNMTFILPLVLTFLPEELYTSHLEKLLPNLINTIETYEDEKVIISVLKIVCNVIVEESGRLIAKPYLHSIIETVLGYIEDGTGKRSKTLKKQSLRCLLGISLFELPLVVPYKKRIIKAAELMLSNSSRSVRMLAVSVRQSWEDLGVDLSM